MLKADIGDLRAEKRRCLNASATNTPTSTPTRIPTRIPASDNLTSPSTRSLLANAAGAATQATTSAKRTRLSLQRSNTATTPPNTDSTTRKSTSMLHRELTAPIGEVRQRTIASRTPGAGTVSTHTGARASRAASASTANPVNFIAGGTKTSSPSASSPTVVNLAKHRPTRTRSSPANMPRTRSILLQQTDGAADCSSDEMDTRRCSTDYSDNYYIPTTTSTSTSTTNSRVSPPPSSALEGGDVTNVLYNSESTPYDGGCRGCRCRQLDGACSDSTEVEENIVDDEEEDGRVDEDVSFDSLYTMVTEAASSFQMSTAHHQQSPRVNKSSSIADHLTTTKTAHVDNGG